MKSITSALHKLSIAKDIKVISRVVMSTGLSFVNYTTGLSKTEGLVDKGVLHGVHFTYE